MKWSAENPPTAEERAHMSADERREYDASLLARTVEFLRDSDPKGGNGAATEDDERHAPPPIDWSLLEGRTPPPRTWWIQDWLSPEPTLCSGAGGIGKSLLWQTLATALATGTEFLGATTTPLNVLLLACEDSENEIWRRQVTICQHFKLGLRALERLHIVPRRGLDNTLLDLTYGRPTFTPEFVLLREQVNDLRADVLILDNIGQTFGGNQNDPHQVTLFVNGLLGLVKSRDFAPVLLGHVARSANSEFAGSAAWENACRMRWYMGTTLPDQKADEDEKPDTALIYLAKRKANYTDRDWRRLRFNEGLLVPERVATGRQDAQARDEAAEQCVLAAVAKLKFMGIAVTDGRTSEDYLPKQILAKKLADSYRKAELTAAMHRLMTQGRLKREPVGKYANRMPKYGLVIVEAMP